MDGTRGFSALLFFLFLWRVYCFYEFKFPSLPVSINRLNGRFYKLAWVKLSALWHNVVYLFFIICSYFSFFRVFEKSLQYVKRFSRYKNPDAVRQVREYPQNLYCVGVPFPICSCMCMITYLNTSTDFSAFISYWFNTQPSKELMTEVLY